MTDNSLIDFKIWYKEEYPHFKGALPIKLSLSNFLILEWLESKGYELEVAYLDGFNSYGTFFRYETKEMKETFRDWNNDDKNIVINLAIKDLINKIYDN